MALGIAMADGSWEEMLWLTQQLLDFADLHNKWSVEVQGCQPNLPMAQASSVQMNFMRTPELLLVLQQLHAQPLKLIPTL